MSLPLDLLLILGPSLVFIFMTSDLCRQLTDWVTISQAFMCVLVCILVAVIMPPILIGLRTTTGEYKKALLYSVLYIVVGYVAINSAP